MIVHMKQYKLLEQVFVKIRNIGDVINELCYGRPLVADGMDRIHTLQEIRQEIIESEIVAEAIKASLSNKSKLGDWEVANLHCISRLHRTLKNVPADLLSALTTARIDCRNRWLLFREGSESAKNVMERLVDVVKLSSEVAQIKSGDLGLASKYDVMLKMHDGDMDTKRIDEVFTDLGAFYRQFFSEVLEKQSGSKIHLAKSITCEKQRLLHEYLEASIYASDISLVDVHRKDYGCSIFRCEDFGGVSCDELDYRVGLRGALDNIGRTLYCVNLPKRWRRQPVGDFPGSVMFEAQGMLMSRHLLMDSRFMSFVLPAMKKTFSLRGKVADSGNVHRYLSEVRPELLLERADEVSSLAHVMLRCALEKELINGDLAVEDLPDAWEQGVKYYFNQVTKTEQEGLLQDDYWVSGCFGYLPSKVLGAIAATQIFSYIDDPKVAVLENIESGDFSGLTAWLSKYIYSHGGRYSSTTLLKKITGRRIDVDAYKNHLVNRYLSM
ncbi:carboxypeptidase Taq (M32) metallopeptidase family protein [Anaplasma phagocytophilum str. ApMUC09]|uniref:Metal-dependent carboxypeptidase n=1 Tax=Anaplasma phagocytophilum str. ApMUC09 TaxID=1359152 RepID=A0A0F3NA08_ANAPH|nr:carboxypeptidase Taq (M32) metallopeptidase family protein [Anaplasma phagocytophilum str. ApMUC09]SCV62110.1 Putative metalloprotease YpwA [Anaplasma phagocytophilum]